MSEEKEMMKPIVTHRGFDIIEFKDVYGEQCSIQESSSAEEPMLWVGIDNPPLTVFEEGMGKYVKIDMPKQFRVFSRMHINKQMAQEIITILQKFVDTESIS